MIVRADRPVEDQEQLWQKAESLRASGLPVSTLRLAAERVRSRGHALRDAVVLEEARKLTGDPAAPDPLTAWLKARTVLRESLAPSTYRMWIKPLRPVGGNGDRLALTAVPSVANWTRRRYTPLIGEALQARTEYAQAVIL